jgi:hypothetical protein
METGMEHMGRCGRPAAVRHRVQAARAHGFLESLRSNGFSALTKLCRCR